MDQTDTAVIADTVETTVSEQRSPDAKRYVVHTQAGYKQTTKKTP